MRYFTFLIATASLGGCVLPTEDCFECADQVSSSRLYGFTKKSDAHLVVLHDPSSRQKCPLRISIDEKLAADLIPGEVANFGVTIGVHHLSALPVAPCGSSQMKEVKISVKAGDALIQHVNETGFSSDRIQDMLSNDQ